MDAWKDLGAARVCSQYLGIEYMRKFATFVLPCMDTKTKLSPGPLLTEREFCARGLCHGVVGAPSLAAAFPIYGRRRKGRPWGAPLFVLLGVVVGGALCCCVCVRCCVGVDGGLLVALCVRRAVARGHLDGRGPWTRALQLRGVGHHLIVRRGSGGPREKRAAWRAP
eukprot:scaffold166822_cov33-Tisochrysis_lutea.AAC.5